LASRLSFFVRRFISSKGNKTVKVHIGARSEIARNVSR
jgi:hypothetical protein